MFCRTNSLKDVYDMMDRCFGSYKERQLIQNGRDKEPEIPDVTETYTSQPEGPEQVVEAEILQMGMLVFNITSDWVFSKCH